MMGCVSSTNKFVKIHQSVLNTGYARYGIVETATGGIGGEKTKHVFDSRERNFFVADIEG